MRFAFESAISPQYIHNVLITRTSTSSDFVALYRYQWHYCIVLYRKKTLLSQLISAKRLLQQCESFLALWQALCSLFINSSKDDNCSSLQWPS